jgi:hypothetical protein
MYMREQVKAITDHTYAQDSNGAPEGADQHLSDPYRAAAGLDDM